MKVGYSCSVLNWWKMIRYLISPLSLSVSCICSLLTPPVRNKWACSSLEMSFMGILSQLDSWMEWFTDPPLLIQFESCFIARNCQPTETHFAQSILLRLRPDWRLGITYYEKEISIMDYATKMHQCSACIISWFISFLRYSLFKLFLKYFLFLILSKIPDRNRINANSPANLNLNSGN